MALSTTPLSSHNDTDTKTHLALIVLALLAHQIFRIHETYAISTHLFLLLGPPTGVLLVRALASPSSSPTLSLSLFFSPLALTYYPTYALAFALSVLLYRLSPRHPLARFPGPRACRASKLWHACAATLPGRQHAYLLALHQRFGDVVRTGPNELSIRDSALIAALMGSSGVPKGTSFIGSMLSETNVMMVGIQDTQEHLRRRRAWGRGLGPSALKEYEHLIARRARQLVARLEEQEGAVVLGQWFNYFSYDFMCDMAFGGGSELLQEGDKANVWRVIEEGVIPASFFAQVPWLGIYIGHVPAAVKPLNDFLLLGRRFTEERIKRGSTTPDLFHYLNNEDLPEKQPPPMGQLIDDGILAIVAGADTVSSALTSIFFGILTHPETYKALQAEVDRYYPAGEDVFDMKFHRAMTYLQAVINEAVRLFPPILTSSPRKVPATWTGGVHAGSIYIPPGTSFVIPPYSLHRDARNFSLPNAFWPERWLVASGQLSLADAPLPHPIPALLSPPPALGQASTSTSDRAQVQKSGPLEFVHNEAAFMAFSHGPMGCVGKGLAMQEMRAVVCALMQRFEMRLREGWNPASYERAYKDYFIATRPEVPVVLTRRA